MWYEIKDNHITVNIKALPNSSKNIIAEVMADALKIKIKAPAVEGAANKELIKFLSKSFKIPKSEILILSGETGKNKKIKLPLNEKIKNLIKEKENENGKSL